MSTANIEGEGLKLVKNLNLTGKEIIKELRRCIIGQENTLELLILSLLCGGHSILHGLPGLAKTLTVSALARIFDVKFSRIQFTPDLMPSDITGTEIIEEQSDGKKVFKFIEGPIFSNIVLADEINRSPAKTQSALLESMQEYSVTMLGKTYKLDFPFFVFATQNPIEQEGTYTLPEAQLDRFLFNIILNYPSYEEEIQIATQKSLFVHLDEIKPVINKQKLKEFQTLVENILIAKPMLEYVVQIVKQTRPESTTSSIIKSNVAYGAGPRASQYIVIAAKANAGLNGRVAVNIDDIKKVAYPVLNHRIILNYSAFSDNISVINIIEEAINQANKESRF